MWMRRRIEQVDASELHHAHDLGPEASLVAHFRLPLGHCMLILSRGEPDDLMAGFIDVGIKCESIAEVLSGVQPDSLQDIASRISFSGDLQSNDRS